MSRRTLHAAVDLGAGSGRVFVGDVGSGAAQLAEAHRFHYAPRHRDGHLRWDMTRLFEGLRAGLRQAADLALADGALRSVGVDTWGVDYGLLDEAGSLLDEPVCYRDDRTSGVMDRVFALVPREMIFLATGIQLLPFNTLFQLAAQARTSLPARASRLLLMPDLCHHLLCGSERSERTNASTTQMLGVRTGDWDAALLAKVGLPRGLLPELVDAGAVLGEVRGDLRAALDLPPIQVIAPATHDTASAVAGTPLQAGWAYISSGTWSLVGVERDAPLVTGAVLGANFTNERGVGGTIRFLKNVMGLWILESCRREWEAGGPGAPPRLPADAAATARVDAVIFPDDPRFFNPASMLQELRGALAESGQFVPDDPATLTQVILDSLAVRYASVVDTIERLTGASIRGIHIVGGGSLNDYLNQATANATGRPVLAGPVEATALGNLLMQSLACGTIASIEEGRAAIAASLPPRRFEPRNTAVWRAAVLRLGEIEAAL